jgi:hypothetical protein
MRKSYRREDLGPGVRGKYLAAYQKGSNLVLLQPDVAAAFPTSAAVNEALQGLLKVARTAKIARTARSRAATTKSPARPARKAG